MLRPKERREYMMRDENNIQKTAAKIAENTKNIINNKIDDVKERISCEQEQAEEKSKGLSMDEIKRELQCALYSNKIGKFMVSFCEYMMYALIGVEILTFIGRTSTDYRMVNACFEAGILEILIAAVIGIICFIKNKNIPVAIYTIITTVTYFLRMTERSYYNMLNLGILTIMIIIDICIIRRYLKDNDKTGASGKMSSIFRNDNSNNEECKEGTYTEIMIRCPKCGNICSKDDHFCVECGEDLTVRRNPYKSTAKPQGSKGSETRKKTSKRKEDVFDGDKTQFIDRTVIMDNIEQKILKHTED